MGFASSLDDVISNSSHGGVPTFANDQVHRLLPLDTASQDARNHDNHVVSHQDYNLIPCSDGGGVSQNWVPNGQVASSNIIERQFLSSESQVEYNEASHQVLHLQPVNWQLPNCSQNMNIPLCPSFSLNPSSEEFKDNSQISDVGGWNPSEMSVNFPSL